MSSTEILPFCLQALLPLSSSIGITSLNAVWEIHVFSAIWNDYLCGLTIGRCDLRCRACHRNKSLRNDGYVPFRLNLEDFLDEGILEKEEDLLEEEEDLD
jgi:hypothetical protein